MWRTGLPVDLDLDPTVPLLTQTLTLTMFDLAPIHRGSVCVTDPTEPSKKNEFRDVETRRKRICTPRCPPPRQPTHQCSSRVRLSPTLARVISLSCGHDGSSSESSESSEEVRTNRTQPFTPLPVAGTMLTLTSITNSLFFAAESISSHARPVRMWLLSEIDIVVTAPICT